MSTAPRSIDDLRAALRRARLTASPREIARAARVSHTTVYALLGDGDPGDTQAGTIAKLWAWLDSLGQSPVTGAAATTGAAPSTAGEGRVVYPPAYSDGMMAAAEHMARTLTAIIAEARQYRLAPNAVRPAGSASGGATADTIPTMDPDEFVGDVGAAPTRRVASGEGRRGRGSR